MNRKLAKELKEPLDKLRKAFKKLRQKHNLYAYAKALAFDHSGSQALIQEQLNENPLLRGGVYWCFQVEDNLEDCPILHLSYVPRNAETREEMYKNALIIAQETNQALVDAGLQTFWNGCICNTIGVLLLEVEDEELALAEKRPCFCEKIWEMQFQQFCEEKLGKKAKQTGHPENE